ncbi:MAG: hypothetical protein AB7E47_03375 [Desulfovibrionaceae bacterium]
MRKITRDYGGHDMHYYAAGEHADHDDGTTVTRTYAMSPSMSVPALLALRRKDVKEEAARRIIATGHDALAARLATTGVAVPVAVLDAAQAIREASDDIEDELSAMAAVDDYDAMAAMDIQGHEWWPSA